MAGLVSVPLWTLIVVYHERRGRHESISPGDFVCGRTFGHETG
ncbi:hypothetical protein RSSM_05338 [Rhodopirellula sallentina SM41]|uniref:Uncharacterized protein n=1 Tax=Rhodopirellula sallentina SM41 TaxID=1263870 RepID=M5TW26_9BACT|nr:hypothetical protein RSSM_05338 [Rhodopirellula sallentina SM41]